MTDIPEIPETAPAPTAHATPATPTEAAPAAPEAPVAPVSRPEPNVAETARLLAQHFPALFGAGVIKPIKLRIQADIHERAPGVFTKKALSIFLQRHTTGTAYLRALVAEGATRTDLDGQPAGDIAAEHRDAAGVELERRRAIVEAKKQAGREAARASRRDARPPLPSQQAEVSQTASPAAGERAAPRGPRSAPPGASDRADRSARPSQPGQAPRRPRPPQAAARRGPGRPGDAESGAPQRPHKPRPDQRPAPAHERDSSAAPALPLDPEQAAEAAARHQRALLLRSFEQSPLSKANFAALKGLREEALDELLTLAKKERGSR
ncbi:ProQ/FINO family protein [Piscinibacter gummiphilus]|uniref:ProQ/FINO family protein n=1 Tax=Piscinibacter gummiphilus TaxID=946333 RepID=A0ABZ0CYZ3_9BURK|nr:ProQ/FINO family protein [Piscinibacter gummiphilus]WOB10207.1 ProQ/FINO family protein [Piscinibacter gummiphilus]